MMPQARTVMVEKRDGTGGGFGCGRKRPMRFSELLAALAAGDETLYMTTQQARAGGRRMRRRVKSAAH